MDDLISRAALMEYARNHVGHTIDCNDIARFPAVDAEPVRHGRWEYQYNDSICSACGYVNRAAPITRYRNDTPYCPHCGAKMDGGAEDD